MLNSHEIPSCHDSRYHFTEFPKPKAARRSSSTLLLGCNDWEMDGNGWFRRQNGGFNRRISINGCCFMGTCCRNGALKWSFSLIMEVEMGGHIFFAKSSARKNGDFQHAMFDCRRVEQNIQSSSLFICVFFAKVVVTWWIIVLMVSMSRCSMYGTVTYIYRYVGK